MRTYETVIVIDSLLKPEEIDSIINKYERFISANGGKVSSMDRWGKRRLAYEINKRQYGFYVLIRFEGPSAMIKQLDREYRLNESLLRTKIIKLDDKALKVLVQQTAAAAPAEAPAAPATEPAATADEAAPATT
ncbi:MAG TPA: 30S ribosomal protein S6 [bacterium]|nr:30S ribosomal protein S6 [bacterium]HPN34646.1 30S ribosomal protein S6 [bacterium]